MYLTVADPRWECWGRTLPLDPKSLFHAFFGENVAGQYVGTPVENSGSTIVKCPIHFYTLYTFGRTVILAVINVNN